MEHKVYERSSTRNSIEYYKVCADELFANDSEINKDEDDASGSNLSDHDRGGEKLTGTQKLEEALEELQNLPDQDSQILEEANDD